jgi:hypothetical protein
VAFSGQSERAVEFNHDLSVWIFDTLRKTISGFHGADRMRARWTYSNFEEVE